MKHQPREDRIDPETVRAALGKSGVDVSPAEARLLAEHAKYVLAANQSMNLTRIVEPGDVIRLHICDSLAFLQHMNVLTGLTVDIGSGAGYPGIPLAILGSRVLLCESVGKKATFLKACAESLGVTLEVTAMRAEALAIARPESADQVVARAVSSLGSLVELAAPLLMYGGRLICLKGVPSSTELTAGDETARLCGLSAGECIDYRLIGGETRTVVVYRRIGAPSVRLPRREGLAQRQPLVQG